MMITWLFTRNGCTYNRFQKYIELDLRHQCLRNQGWQNTPPRYNPERYRNHYFEQDFDRLLMRFTYTDKRIQERIRLLKTQGVFEIRRFIPYKVAKRIKEAITFSIKLDGRSPDLFIDTKTQNMLEDWDTYCYSGGTDALAEDRRGTSIVKFGEDYEEYDLLKEHKIKMLQVQIEEAISRKYRISFAKGFRIFYEQIIIFLAMIIMLLKANMYSLIYLMFVIKYIFVNSKIRLLIRLIRMICITMLLQYLLYLSNMIAHLSPIEMPEQFQDYPVVHHQESYAGHYMIPILYKKHYFHDLTFAYLFGLPVSKQQISELLYDFILLFLVSNYVFLYQSPVLDRSVKKVFYCFPTGSDDIKKIQRVANGKKVGEGQYDDPVLAQIRWLRQPYLPPDGIFRAKGYSEEEIKLAKKQYDFACQYSNIIIMDAHVDPHQSIQEMQLLEKLEQAYTSDISSQKDLQDKNLHYHLVNYCELKFNEIWSEENICARKWEMKQSNFYFRLVKQGSILVYLTSHIFVLFVILLMATMRQSIIGFIYIGLIGYCYFRTSSYAGDVLNQRDSNLRRLQKLAMQDLKSAQKEKQYLLKQLESGESNCQKFRLLKQVGKLKARIEGLQVELKKFKMHLKENWHFDPQKEAKSQWGIIDFFGTYLLFLGIVDLSITVIYQLPITKGNSFMRGLGLRKIWTMPSPSAEYPFSYKGMVRASQNREIHEFGFDTVNFFTLTMTCFMIILVTFQIEIYNSNGYLKFVTQTDGSLDLLVSLAELKQKSLAYTRNNSKLKKILNIQSKRKALMETIQRVQAKIKRWRLFTNQTLTQKYHLETMSEQRAVISRTKASKTRKKNKRRADDGVFEIKENQDLNKQLENMVEYLENQQRQKKRRVSNADAERIYEQLAKEFVAQKKSKLSKCARCYMCLNKCCVNNIMLKNDRKQLKQILQSHAQGETETPSELERIMMIEAKHMVRKLYDRREGQEQLYLLLKKSEALGSQQTILNLTKFDKKIKINQLENTWAFTRPASIIAKYVELLFYIGITNTNNLIYIFMMFSMYQNAGLMSIIYPISIFGYALIEETRPSRGFWDFIRYYTIFILLLKLVFNLSWLDPLWDSEKFKYYHGLFRLGLENKKSTGEIIMYMIPEMLIINFIILNEITLILNGVYYRTERQIETIYDAVERWKAGGDEVIYQESIKRQQNMDMEKYFLSLEDQRELIKHMDQQKKLEESRNLQPEQDVDVVEKQKEEEKLTLEEEMDVILQEFTHRIEQASSKFSLDETGSESKISKFNSMIRSKQLLKGMENDSLYYVEGERYEFKKVQNSFSTRDLEEELQFKEIEATVSEGEHEADLEHKIESRIGFESKTRPSIFERNEYLKSVFPSQKIQKPGYDFYGFTTFVLGVLAVFVLIGIDKVFVSQEEILGKAAKQQDVFTRQASLGLLLILILIILERYINRANIMKSDEQPAHMKGKGNHAASKQVFDQILKMRTMTSSMTMSQQLTIKTMKTADITASAGDSQEILEKIISHDAFEDHSEEISTSQTRISFQKKLKYVIHWILIVAVHLDFFWIIPIKGNKRLYHGKPYCEADKPQEFPYGCKNFHNNTFLIIFYLLFCCYFTLSALQLRYGMPIWKKASSLMQHMDYDSISGQVGYISAQAYMSIPFALELRCLFDFVFTKTSLDVFQYWQLFTYQMEMYIAHFGNQSYVVKVMGAPVEFLDYLLGYVFLVVILVAILGPFYFFSEFSNFSALNPVVKSDLKVALIINKTLSLKDLVDRTVPNHTAPPVEDPYVDDDPLNSWQRFQNDSSELFIKKENEELFREKNLATSVPFRIFQVFNPNMRTVTNEHLKTQDYSKWAETKFFKNEQIQEVIATEYPDNRWYIDKLNRDFFRIDLKNTIIKEKFGYNIQLMVKGEFHRNGPPDHKISKNKQFKLLNSTLLDDCITTQQLIKFADLDCGDSQNQNIDKSIRIPWTQAYNPFLILGQTSRSVPIIRKVLTVDGETNGSFSFSHREYWKKSEIIQDETLVEDDQKYDVLLEFRCPDKWLVRMSKEPTQFQDWELKNELRVVDPKTCIPTTSNQTYLAYLDYKGDLIGNLDSEGELKRSKRFKPKHEREDRWTRLQFTLFSMFVSSGFFASYTVGAFYTVFLYGLSPLVRNICLFGTWKGMVYEITDATTMMRLYEACYMFRHEQDLYHEEETYRMIQEIIRSPGLLKLLTGSSLRGTLDPQLDTLKYEVRKKLERLDMLEQKGFDVGALRERVLKDQDEQFQAILKMKEKRVQ